LTCSDIDALPSFPGASTVSSSSKFIVEDVLRETINIFKSGTVSKTKMQEKFVVYLIFMTAPEESYVQN